MWLTDCLWGTKFYKNKWLIISIGTFLYFFLIVSINRYINCYTYEKPIVSSMNGYCMDGFILNGGTYSSVADIDTELSYRGSYGNAGDKTIGSFSSPWYYANGEVVLYLCGYYALDGMEFYIETLDGEKYFVNQTIGEKWCKWSFDIGDCDSFRIVATDNCQESCGWMAFSEPQYAKRTLVWARDIYELLSVPMYILIFAFWCIPGYAILAYMYKQKKYLGNHINIYALILLAVVSYFFFWIRMVLGNHVKYIIIFIWAICVGVLWINREALKQINQKTNFISQIKWILLVFAFYISVLYLYSVQDGYGCNFLARRFMPTEDNVFPLAFVEKIVNGEALNSSLLGWQTSDRPPLLAAMYSTVCCFVPWHNREKMYLVFAILLQLSVWFVVFEIVSFFNMSKFQKKYLMILIAFSSTVCMNSVFTWPKFMACTFYFMAILVLFDWMQGRKLNRFNQYLVGICMALAMLSHGNIAFAIVSTGIFLALRKKIRWQETPRIIIGFCLLYIPWMFYQKVIDPPGDILLRAYFAGTWENNGNSLLNSIIAAYSGLSLGEWIKGRIVNIIYLFPGVLSGNSFWCNFWNNKWSRLFSAIGLDLLVLICFYAKNRIHSDKLKSEYFIGSFITTIVLQTLLYYTPGDTIIHQCTYSNIIYIFVICACQQALDNIYVQYALIIMNLFEIIPAFVINPMLYRDHIEYADIFWHINYFALGFALLFATLLLIYLLKGDLRRKKSV